jgi:hypothetical protein
MLYYGPRFCNDQTKDNVKRFYLKDGGMHMSYSRVQLTPPTVGLSILLPIYPVEYTSRGCCGVSCLGKPAGKDNSQGQ